MFYVHHADDLLFHIFLTESVEIRSESNKHYFVREIYQRWHLHW